ncbi:MAG: Fe-S protein assembly co-chaperone HscB [Pseudomonadota bacterium]
MQNHFELFHLPLTFAIDSKALDDAYHDVQNQVHPDKFSTAGDAEKRVAMQWATRANEAYQTLKHPLKRAIYLCQLNGIDLQGESSTAMPPDFLMQQMAWREALDDAHAMRDEAALSGLEATLRQNRMDEIAQLETLFDQHDFVAAAMAARRLMFIEKFGEEVANAYDEPA